MKQVRMRTPNYTCDLSGACSALFELGGLVVMHDASGCNSTFATHDEPRWYDTDSMVYISGLTEYDTVFGNDDAYIDDIVEVALERRPAFVAVFGSPVALMMGTDFGAVARIIEQRCGILTFAIQTSGMASYISGASQAFAAVAKRLLPGADVPGVSGVSGVDVPDVPVEICRASHVLSSSKKLPRVNLLGVTPLDFSVVGNVCALRSWCEDAGFLLLACWAMGSTLDQLRCASSADVNIVVSSSGLSCARVLQQKYKTPYVVGCPTGASAAHELARLVRKSASDGKNRMLNAADTGISADKDSALCLHQAARQVTIVGEAVISSSLRWHLVHDLGEQCVRVLCPLPDPCHMLGKADLMVRDEQGIARVLRTSDVVIADPLYEVLLDSSYACEVDTKPSIKFVRMPHEAYSGRMFRQEIPVFVG